MPPSGRPAQPLSASCSDLRLQGDEQGASALLLLQLDFPAAALARKFLDQARLCVRRLAVTLLGLCVDGTDGERHGQSRRRDRKSTRLNSSHMSISYAVFCL